MNFAEYTQIISWGKYSKSSLLRKITGYNVKTLQISICAAKNNCNISCTGKRVLSSSLNIKTNQYKQCCSLSKVFTEVCIQYLWIHMWSVRTTKPLTSLQICRLVWVFAVPVYIKDPITCHSSYSEMSDYKITYMHRSSLYVVVCSEECHA